MKLSTAAVAASIMLLQSGCASIVSGTNQPITVDTPDCAGAMCRLTNSKGTWVVKTPGSVVVHRAYGPLTLVCTKTGYPSTTTQVDSKTKGMAFGNILVGGLVGTGVDMSTGAAYDYPNIVTVPMNCSADAAIVQQPPQATAAFPAFSNTGVGQPNGNGDSDRVRQLQEELDRANRELETSRRANAERVSAPAASAVGRFTGNARTLTSATGAKRLSCEYSFGNSRTEWHEVFGNCPSEWTR